MGERFGRYELQKKLGSGGMGEVFLAKAGQQTVVLKRLLPHLVGDLETQALFLQEARLASQVRHPNLVKVIELGQAEGQWFIAMEYVRGVSLHDLMARGPVAANEAVRIVADVAGALAAVHAAHDSKGRALFAVHRDVTPRNIIVGADKAVKLIDFGVSAAEGGGTLEYTAPEGAIDRRSDQFSLGVVFWELLSGRGLFHGETDAQTIELVEALKIGRPPKAVSDEVCRVVMRMLSREPTARFHSCEEVRVTLLELLDAPTAPMLSSKLETRLERPMTSFIGRELELAALKKLVDGGVQYLTLVGPPGIGRTRVALELTERVGPRVEVTIAVEPTGGEGEVVYTLPPLNDVDAAALAFDRSHGRPGLGRALDGLALTIELIAAQGGTASNDLKGAFNASWAVLKKNERALLVVLAQADGSMSLDEAEAFAPDALELLETMRDAALIQVVEVGEGELRFTMHDAIRGLVRNVRG